MRRRPPPLVVVGGEPAPATGALVAALLDEPDPQLVPRLVVWDQLAVGWRWRERPAAIESGHRPVRRRLESVGLDDLGRRAGQAELKAYLRRHRAADVVVVGRHGLACAPWFREHRGARIWIPTPDDLVALEAGFAVPAEADGGPERIVSVDTELGTSERLRHDDRHRWVPGFLLAPPAAVGRAEVLACGPPDRTHGVDLVGRAVAARAPELRALGARVTWLAPEGSALPDEEHQDLRRAEVDDLVEVQVVPDVADAVAERLPGAAALVGRGRPGGHLAIEARALAHRLGVHVVDLAPEPAPPPELASRCTGPAFGDVLAVGDALVAAVRRSPSGRPLGPVGLAELVDRAVGRG
ncbi:MAG: hypothetical protein R2746_14220 [Acidimicrobiales bacterium]